MNALLQYKSTRNEKLMAQDRWYFDHYLVCTSSTDDMDNIIIYNIYNVK